MERRGFFRALLGLGASVVCAPMAAEAMKAAPVKPVCDPWVYSNPPVIWTGITVGDCGGAATNNLYYFQNQLTYGGNVELK